MGGGKGGAGICDCVMHSFGGGGAVLLLAWAVLVSGREREGNEYLLERESKGRKKRPKGEKSGEEVDDGTFTRDYGAASSINGREYCNFPFPSENIDAQAGPYHQAPRLISDPPNFSQNCHCCSSCFFLNRETPTFMPSTTLQRVHL